jgi:hypothetical protein
MKSNRPFLGVLAAMILTIPALGLSAGKVSYSDLSMVGGGATKAEGHTETIEISSWSLGATNPAAGNTYRGHTTVNQGILNFTARTPSPSATRLCQSQARVPSLLLEADGKRIEFQNVVFKECTPGGTFTLTFNGQTTTGASPRQTMNTEIANVTITGLTRMKCQNNLKQISLGAHDATLYVGSANGGVWKTTDGGVPAPGQMFPSVVIENRMGAKVVFTNATLREVSNDPATSVQKIVLAFESTTATPQSIQALTAGH